MSSLRQSDSLILQETATSNLTLEWMKSKGIPLTRKNYLALAYLGKPPAELDAEQEAEIPEELTQQYVRFRRSDILEAGTFALRSITRKCFANSSAIVEVAISRRYQCEHFGIVVELHTIIEETTTDPKKDHLSLDDPVADRIPDQVRHGMAVRP
jgi:hypothetical protein